MTKARVRLDRLLVDRGLASTRERAQALILAGKVLVSEQKIEKPGTAVDSDSPLRLLGEQLRYVGRGGLKLEAALRSWRIDLNGKICLDVGASTGGFTDCMLQHGAAQVIAIDTGYGQMDAQLRKDPRVTLHERTNARYLAAAIIGSPIHFAAIDVSFISVTLVLPAVLQAAAPKEAVILIKPQFEAGRGKVGKGGIVRDATTQAAAVEKVKTAVTALGGTTIAVMESPIRGTEGNLEFLLHAFFQKS